MKDVVPEKEGSGWGAQLFLPREGGDLQEDSLRGDRKEVVGKVDVI